MSAPYGLGPACAVTEVSSVTKIAPDMKHAARPRTIALVTINRRIVASLKWTLADILHRL